MKKMGIILGIMGILTVGGCDPFGGGPPHSDYAEPEAPSDPDPVIPGLPDIEICQDEAHLRLPIRGNSTKDSSYVWFAIGKNDSVYVRSLPTCIMQGSYKGVWLDGFFDYNKVPADTYNLMLYYADQKEDAGIEARRSMANGPFKINMAYANADSQCIDELLLGDSVYFWAESTSVLLDTVIEKWIIHASTDSVPNDNNSWFMVSNQYNGDVTSFIKLDSNLFMPLKLTRKVSADTTILVDWILYSYRKTPEGKWRPIGSTRLIVDPPAGLGYTNNDYDETIIRTADYFGLPPQLIKAIIKREEVRFTSHSFRYEINYDNVSLQYALRHPDSFPQTEYYKHYYLTDSIRSGQVGYWAYRTVNDTIYPVGNPIYQGDSVAYLYYDPYSCLSEWSFPTFPVQDLNHNGFITANELIKCDPLNNAGRGWPSDANTYYYDFIPQIIISSSYGLMHTMVTSLVDYVHFGSNNPQHLADDSTGIFWGTKYLKEIYNTYSNDSTGWDIHIKSIIGKYNGGPGAVDFSGIFYYYDKDRKIWVNNLSVNDYVNSVISNMNIYQPIK